MEIEVDDTEPGHYPPSAKHIASTDLESARKLDMILRRVPSARCTTRAVPFPLLTRLIEDDSRRETDLARQLLFVAATIHVSADERRTAEYLLRHQQELIAGLRSALSLLLAARCAAEMDVRRVQYIEIPTDLPGRAILAAVDQSSRVADPSVGELVIDFLSAAVGTFPGTSVTRSRLLDAVSVAVELSQRHTRNGGSKPSFVAMRSDARKESRLVTSLRSEFGNPTAARGLARLLVGSDRSPFESSLLWWVADPQSKPAAVPVSIKTRWTRDLAIADRALRVQGVSHAAPQKLKATDSGVSDEMCETRYIGFGA